MSAIQSELSELKARHNDELSSLRVELDETVNEYSTLSYNSRVVCVFYYACFNLLPTQNELFLAYRGNGLSYPMACVCVCLCICNVGVLWINV